MRKIIPLNQNLDIKCGDLDESISILMGHVEYPCTAHICPTESPCKSLCENNPMQPPY